MFIIDESGIWPRREKARKLLKKVLPDKRDIASSLAVSETSRFIIGVHTGEKPDRSHTEWRFKTLNPSYRANYYEIWSRSTKGNTWMLNQIYFHLYIVRNSETEDEFLALHAEPGSYKKGHRYQYKVGPHIHIKSSEMPLPKFHIALNEFFIDRVFINIEQFDKVFEAALIMIKKELLVNND